MKRTFIATILAAGGLVFGSAAWAKETKVSVNTGASVVGWEGKKVLVPSAHHGKVKIKSGDLTMADGKVTGGQIVVDMTSITNEDLTKQDQNAKLVGHLSSEDFFDVKKFPTATLKITKATKGANGEYDAEGNLTIKSDTHPVTFKVKEKQTGDTTVFATALEIDRTKWNVRYGSGKFFTNLGDKVIADNIKFDVQVAVNTKEITSAKK